MSSRSISFSSSVIVVCAVLSLAAVAGAQQAMRLTINGAPASEPPVTVKGKTYISLAALKAAGVGVSTSGDLVSLTIPTTMTAQGGANQQNGVEGKIGEWLFNGIWRFRVISVAKADPGKEGTGWVAKMEIRNGSKFGGYSPGGTGWQGLSIVTEDGMSVDVASGGVDLSSPGLAQGASNTQSLFFPTESASKPVRLILRFDQKGLEGTPAGLRFTVKDPSFRVDIKDAVTGA